jgi:riboflavin kinase
MGLNLVSDMPRASPKSQYSSKSFYVEGKVFSGGGEGAKFIALPWVRKQIAEKLGFTPYSGTLDLRMTEADVDLKKSLKNARSIEISPAEGFCRGRCFNAYFMDTLKCAIVIPEVENYPEDVIEIIAPINLRETFILQDGDVIEVKIVI